MARSTRLPACNGFFCPNSKHKKEAPTVIAVASAAAVVVAIRSAACAHQSLKFHIAPVNHSNSVTRSHLYTPWCDLSDEKALFKSIASEWGEKVPPGSPFKSPLGT